jgi:hypothetical protein
MRGQQTTLFGLDCGATNWRLYRANYEQLGNQVRLLGEPQPSPLTSFSGRKLPAVFSLNPEGTAIDAIGEVAQAQLEDETVRGRVREYFKPCIGAHLEADPLPHQKRYTHAQALKYTGMLLETILDQLQQEKWRASDFDQHVRFAFAYPVHWEHDHEGEIFADFEQLVLSHFPASLHEQIHFVPEPEGAILSLKRQGLLETRGEDGITLILDVGGSTTDIVAGRLSPHSGELLYLGRYGEPFGGGLYDAEMAKYLADALHIPASVLADDPSALVTLRVFGKRLKEALSRQLLRAQNGTARSMAQRTITLVTSDGQIYRQVIRLDEEIFHRITGHLHLSFDGLVGRALRSMEISERDLGQVVLVGGGVQLFSLVDYLRDRFGPQKVVLADNPEEIVVRGVCLQYGNSLGALQPGSSLILESPGRAAPADEAAPASRQSWQIVTKRGEAHPLRAPRVTVGRGRDNHIRLQSEKVSRQHAIFRYRDSAWEIIDQGSTNGTFLNKQRLQPEQAYALQNGDEIRFGDRRFFVKAIDDQA